MKAWLGVRPLFRHHDNAILVGIQHVAGPYPDALDLYRDVALAFTALFGRQGHRRNGANTGFALSQFGAIADGAINHDAGPAVFRRRFAEIAADQGPAQRSSAIDNQHAAFTRRIHRGLDEGVVLVAFHGTYRSAELEALAKIAKYRGQHAKLAAAVVFVRIAQITGRKGFSHHRFQKIAKR
jgi:hypothetical protein